MEAEPRYNIIMKEYDNALDFAVDLAKICVESNGEWKTGMRTAVFMLAFLYGVSYNEVYKNIEDRLNE